MPGPGGYWLRPPLIASVAAASIAAGPSVSGKPWPRLTELVRTASADISAKTVVPNGRMRATRGSAFTMPFQQSTVRRTSTHAASLPLLRGSSRQNAGLCDNFPEVVASSGDRPGRSLACGSVDPRRNYPPDPGNPDPDARWYDDRAYSPSHGPS